MPSRLRNQASFEHVSANVTYTRIAPPSPPTKRMSLTQTYYVASTARSKLGREAGRADHNLRRLVGHANLLDTLMVELADAEREQEAWFHQAVTKAAKPEEPRHVQWIDTIAEVAEEVDAEDSDDDSDFGSDSDSEVYDEEMYEIMPLRRIRSPPVQVFSTVELPEDDEDFSDNESIAADDEDDASLTLTRTVSKHASPSSPPELTHDSDSESDDDSLPSSPEQPTFALADPSRKNLLATPDFYDMKDLLLPQTAQAPLIAAC